MIGTDVADPVWSSVGRWIDASPSVEALQRHRIGLLAVRRLRETGHAVPEDLLREERDASVVAMTAPMVLARVRELVEGPVVVFKGLEVAALYHDPVLRCSFHDIDLLVPDAPAAQAALVSGGFTPLGEPGEYRDLHHLQPLAMPGLPVIVEVHHHPKWLRWSPPIDPAGLFAAAEPSRTGIDGVTRLAPAHHALVVAAHAWSNSPLSRLRDLLDIHLIAREAGPGEVAAAARAWNMERVWRTTREAAASMLDPSARVPWSLRTWARGLRAADVPRRSEALTRPALSPFWALSAAEVPKAVGGVAYRDLSMRAKQALRGRAAGGS